MSAATPRRWPMRRGSSTPAAWSNGAVTDIISRDGAAASSTSAASRFIRKKSKPSSTGMPGSACRAPNPDAARSPAPSWSPTSFWPKTPTPAGAVRSAIRFWPIAGPRCRLTRSPPSSGSSARSISPRPESWLGTMHNVLVTGGSRGIGLAISRRTAGAGYNVIAVARRESDELKAAISEAVKQGAGGLHFRAFDLSDIDAIPTFLTRSLAREVGKLGITVNAIAPGFVDTELTQSLAPEQRKRIASRSALRRLPETDDVASMVEYL